MNGIKAFLLLLISVTLFASKQLQSTYYINHNSIFLSDIIPSSVTDKELFKIDRDRHSKRVKTTELLQLLNSLGYKKFTSKHNYTEFIQKSPISTIRMEHFVKEKYLALYKNIRVKSVLITPRTYRETLPLKYKIFLRKRALLSKKGILYIETPDNKKIFFDYRVDAKVDVIVAKNIIQRDDEISYINSKKKSIMLNKFRAMPLVNIPKSKYQAKHRIRKESVITQRDLSGLYLVKRGATINISVKDANILVSLSAKADRSARYGETITFTADNGRKIKAIVTGHNRAEMR